MTGLTLLLAFSFNASAGALPQAPSAASSDMIVFRSDRDIFDGDLYRMDHHGGSVRRLTASRGTERQVAVNAQGTKLAFFRDVGYGLGVKGLYTIGADGVGERLLVRMTDCGSIAFSPDGSRIAFVNVDYAVGPTNEIYFVNSDGSGLVRFTNKSYANNIGLAWSRDGSTIAYMRYQPTPGVWYVPTVGGPSTQVVSGEEPSFSATGDKLMYSRSINGFKRVYWSDLQGRNEHQVLSGYNLGRAMFDVNGSSVVFTAFAPKQQVFLMDGNQNILNLSNDRFSDSDAVIAGS